MTLNVISKSFYRNAWNENSVELDEEMWAENQILKEPQRGNNNVSTENKVIYA